MPLVVLFVGLTEPVPAADQDRAPCVARRAFTPLERPLIITHVNVGRGKFLLPGLADMHMHYWAPGEAALFLANGVTHVRNMSGAPLQLAMQRKVARRELLGPHLITTTPLVDGANADGRPVWAGSTCVTEPSQAADIARRFAARGYQQLKVYQLLTFEVHRALAAAAAEVGLRVTGHCPDGMTYEHAIANGQTCFEHLTGISTVSPASRRPLGSDHHENPSSPSATTTILPSWVNAAASAR